MKFVQLVSHGGELYALDSEGAVWRMRIGSTPYYSPMTGATRLDDGLEDWTWERIPSRAYVPPPPKVPRDTPYR